MENFVDKFNVQAPAPNIVNSSDKNNNKGQMANDKKPKRKINTPNVGVVDAPNISRTPIADFLQLKKDENPKTAYKLTTKNKVKGVNLSNILSVAIGVCSIISFTKLAGGKIVKNKP